MGQTAGDIGDAAGQKVFEAEIVRRCPTTRDDDRKCRRVASLSRGRANGLIDAHFRLNHVDRVGFDCRKRVACPGELGRIGRSSNNLRHEPVVEHDGFDAKGESVQLVVCI